MEFTMGLGECTHASLKYFWAVYVCTSKREDHE